MLWGSGFLLIPRADRIHDIYYHSYGQSRSGDMANADHICSLGLVLLS